MDHDSSDEVDDLADEWFDESLFADFGLSAHQRKAREFLLPDLSAIDWEALKSGLSGATFVPKLSPVPRWLRIIDVVQRKIIKAPPEPFEYVCLSYTWGNVQGFQAKTNNITKLERNGALDSPENPEESEGPSNRRVPATIRDAMAACQNLGKRYLWVDRLCILQDGSAADKQVHFGDMGRIYNHAIVTLVAFEGTGARYGLHGISRPFDLGASEEDFWTRSEWSKRGWTYQEAMLSRNMILFLTDGVILEHDGEAFLSQRIEGPNFIRYTMLFHGAIDYYQAVERYTERSLRHQQDIVNAFSGICCHLFDKNHLFGMPTNDFDDAMHWCVKDAHRRRRPSRNGHIFPTWSWASMEGRVVFPTNLRALAIAFWTFVDSIDGSGTTSMKYPKPKFNFRLRLHQGIYKDDVLMTLALHAHVNGYASVPQGEPVPRSMAPGEFRQKFSSFRKFWEHCRGISLTPDLSSWTSPLYFDGFSHTQRHLANLHGRMLANSWVSILQIKPQGDGETVFDYRIYDDIDDCVGVGHFDCPRKRQELMNIAFFALSASAFESWELTKLFSHDDANLVGVGNMVFTSGMAIEQSSERGVFNRVGFAIVKFDWWFLFSHRKRRSVVLE